MSCLDDPGSGKTTALELEVEALGGKCPSDLCPRFPHIPARESSRMA